MYQREGSEENQTCRIYHREDSQTRRVQCASRVGVGEVCSLTTTDLLYIKDIQ